MLIIAAVAFTAAIAAVALMQLRDSANRPRVAGPTRPSTVLRTAALRSVVSDMNPNHQRRYFQEQAAAYRQFDRLVIKSAKDGSGQAAVQHARAANDAVVTLEDQVSELLLTGQRAEAANVVASARYRTAVAQLQQAEAALS